MLYAYVNKSTMLSGDTVNDIYGANCFVALFQSYGLMLMIIG